MQYKCDILILGAGAAGIAAAAELSTSNLTVKIIEARDRIGGRIFTSKSEAPFPLELGAEFVHGRERHLWNLLEHYQMRLGEVADTNWFKSAAGLTYDHNYYLKIEPQMKRLVTRAKEGNDISLAQFAREQKLSYPENREDIEALVAFIADNTTAEAEDLSLHYLTRCELASYTIGQGQLRPLDGYIELLNSLASQFLKTEKLFLNSQATKVEWSRGAAYVTVNGANGTDIFETKKVLITVPLGVLKLKAGTPGAIIFSPPLIAKEEALNGLKMGQVTRIAATFRKRFWGELSLLTEDGGNIVEWGHLHCPDVPIKHWWSQYPDLVNQLIGWCTGPTPPQFLNADKAALRQAVITSLSHIFSIDKEQIDNYLIDVFFHDWNNDPLCNGSYSHCLPGHWEAPVKLAEPLDNTLYFAGEATDKNGFTGTVHGALRSGLRAAEEILRAHASGL